MKLLLYSVFCNVFHYATYMPHIKLMNVFPNLPVGSFIFYIRVCTLSSRWQFAVHTRLVFEVWKLAHLKINFKIYCKCANYILLIHTR